MLIQLFMKIKVIVLKSSLRIVEFFLSKYLLIWLWIRFYLFILITEEQQRKNPDAGLYNILIRLTYYYSYIIIFYIIIRRAAAAPRTAVCLLPTTASRE